MGEHSKQSKVFNALSGLDPVWPGITLLNDTSHKLHPWMILPYTVNQWAKFGLYNIVKQQNIDESQGEFHLNVGCDIFFKFFDSISQGHSYKQITQFDKKDYRITRRITILTWILSDFLYKGYLDSPLSAHWSNKTQCWRLDPGSTREPILYWFDINPTIKNVYAVVPDHYTGHAMKPVMTFETASDVKTHFDEFYPERSPDFDHFRTKSWLTADDKDKLNMGVAIGIHKDSDDEEQREKYWNMLQHFWKYTKVKIEASDIVFKDPRNNELLNHHLLTSVDPDIHIILNDSITDDTILYRTLLILPFLHLKQSKPWLDFMFKNKYYSKVKLNKNQQ